MAHSDPRHARGRAGEEIARLFLETRGYCVVAQRFRAGRRELDLIVERGEQLVAVEVKWRRSGEAVDAWRPAQRARAAAAVYEAMDRLVGGRDRPWRLDLIAIEERADGIALTHRVGAWSPGGSFW